MTWLWILAAVAALALLLYLEFIRRDRGRIAAYGEATREFYERIAPVIRDDETPPEVLRMIGFLNSKIDNPRAALQLIAALNDDTDSRAERPELHRALDEFFERRPELLEPYVRGLAAALLAVTFRSILRGPTARRKLVLLRRHKEIAPLVAGDFKRSGEGKVNGGAVPQAA